MSAPSFFFVFFLFFYFLKYFLFQKICPRVNVSATCQFVVVLFFLFNLVPIFVIFVQFCPKFC